MQFWSGRTIPLGWTRWNPLWTLILVLMVAATAGEVDDAAGAADHGLSNIYSGDGTLRAARHGKRSTGELARIGKEIEDLEKREKDADGRLRVAEEELERLPELRKTNEAEKANVTVVVRNLVTRVNSGRQAYETSKVLTDSAEKQLNGSTKKLNEANLTFYGLRTDFLTALSGYAGSIISYESLEAEYVRDNCAPEPAVKLDVQGALTQLNDLVYTYEVEIITLDGQRGVASEDAQLDREIDKCSRLVNATQKEHDHLQRIVQVGRDLKAAEVEMCRILLKDLPLNDRALENNQNLTTQRKVAFESNSLLLNQSREAEAELQEKLNEINGNLTRAGEDKIAANRELTDVRAKLAKARKELKRQGKTAGEQTTKAEDTKEKEEKPSGFVWSFGFWALIVVGILVLICLVYTVYYNI